MGNVPRISSSLVGRDEEIVQAANLLGAHRLVTLVGAPGVGKTRLALEVASRLEAIFHDGAWLVELSGVRDPAALPQVVAAALGVHPSSGSDVAEALEGFLRARRVVLVVDNAEHLVAECAELVVRLMRGSDSLSVLVTSRQPLDIPGEHVFVVRPLELAEDSPEEAALSPAVRLFVERARAVRPRFAATADTAGPVVEICRHVDGLPLAIELAAACVKTMSVQEIAARLDDRLDVLARDPNGNPRHQSLGMALEWSYDLLTETERSLLRRLSVFAAPFTAEAAAAVAGTGAPAVTQALGALASKSLVVAGTGGRAPRYRLLETVRAFAGERLEEEGEGGETARLHTSWFTNIAAQAEDRLSGPDQLEALDDLDAEYPDLRRALERAAGSGHHEESLRLAGGLTLYWRIRGQFTEGRRWLSTALEAPTTQADVMAAALWGAGFLAMMAGDNESAVEALESCLTLAREHCDRRREARALLLQGNVQCGIDYGLALELLESSYALAADIGDSWCAAHAMALIGGVKRVVGEPRAAEISLESGIAIARRSQDPQGLRLALVMLADLRTDQGRFKDAEALYGETLDLGTKLKEPYIVVEALRGLGWVSFQQGELERAGELFHEALSGFHDLSSFQRANLLLSLGQLAIQQGRLDEGLGRCRDAIDIFRQAGLPTDRAATVLAFALITQGDLVKARAALNEAGVDVEQSEAPSATAESRVLNVLGMLATAEKNLEQATARFQQALVVDFRSGHLGFTAAGLLNIASVALKRRRFSESTRLLAASEALRQAHGLRSSATEDEWGGSHRRRAVAAVGQERFDSLWDEGSSMTAEEAVSYALRDGNGGSPKSGWPSLTKTDRKIVALVADGMTNAEVASRLFLSPRTVEAHLTRVFAKLGVMTRTQLAVIAHERGVISKI